MESYNVMTQNRGSFIYFESGQGLKIGGYEKYKRYIGGSMII